MKFLWGLNKRSMSVDKAWRGKMGIVRGSHFKWALWACDRRITGAVRLNMHIDIRLVSLCAFRQDACSSFQLWTGRCIGPLDHEMHSWLYLVGWKAWNKFWALSGRTWHVQKAAAEKAQSPYLYFSPWNSLPTCDRPAIGRPYGLHVKFSKGGQLFILGFPLVISGGHFSGSGSTWQTERAE